METRGYGRMRITELTLEEYRGYLQDEERSSATVEKYLRDVRKFIAYLSGDMTISKDKVREYKQWLKERYTIASANSMLAAVNSFFTYLGQEEWKVRLYKIQRAVYSKPEREMTKADYKRLVCAARKEGDMRMSMLIQTICSTGIRISELKYITVESLGVCRAEIYNKGKSRLVLIPSELARALKKYCKEEDITSGSIFVTKNGKPMDRSNISKRMKQIGKTAGVDSAKVFPHNLRHLFARSFYNVEKDVVRLMDLLGHSNISTTRIYTVDTEERPREQMARMHLVLD